MKLIDKMYRVHSLFLDSINPFILGEILVGTLAYATPNNLTPKSDIDSIVIIKKERLRDILNSKFFKGVIDPEFAFEALDKGIADYLVLKTTIEGVDLSVDIITEEFFSMMCNIDISNQNRTWYSAKFGNLPQRNSYPSTEFNGRVHIIEKNNLEFKGGYAVELPLFFIFNNNGQKNYSYGMPTVKLLTSKVNIDKEKVSANVRSLFSNVVKRMMIEYPRRSAEEYCNYFFNLLVKRDKFPREYSIVLADKVKEEVKCQEN